MLDKIKAALKTQEPIEQIKDSEVIDQNYRFWRKRLMYSMMIGYATFYFVRKNMSMANPALCKEFGFTNTEMGIILSVATIVYAISKFTSGIMADRSNPRYLMATGLVIAATMNIFFGLSSALLFFVIFWAINNLFQGMGMPPCSRLLTMWFSPSESGRAWGIWNASHQLGGFGIMLISGFLIAHYGWRSAFIVPAIFALFISLFIINRLRDTPQSLGLPPVEVYKGDSKAGTGTAEDVEKESGKEIFIKHILKNRVIWILASANFFVYIVRIGILDWGPKLLVESKGLPIDKVGMAVSTFEVAGMIGAFCAGLLSDKIFKSRRGPVAVIYMLLLIGAILGMIFVPKGHSWYLYAGSLMTIGFFVYGPQMLVAVAAADFATKKAAATAVGLTGLFGYIGATVCGIGTGIIVDKWGWNGGLIFYCTAALIGTVLFLFTWNKRSPVLDQVHK